MNPLRKIPAFLIIIGSIIVYSCIQKNPINHENGFLKGADGANLYYEMIGSRTDTVVVIHGGPGAGINSVLPDFKPLAENFTLIFYDQRGGGKSTLPEDTTKLQPEYFTADLEAVRSHFNLGKMNILTHSFGSIITVEYAIKYPHRINRIVFHGATGPVRADMAEYYRKTAEINSPSPDTSLSNHASELLQSLLNGTAENARDSCLAFEKIATQLYEMRGEKVSWQGTTCNASPEAVRYYYKYTAQLVPRYYGMWDYTSKLGHVTSPLLVIYGEEDALAHKSQRDWVESFQNGELLLVPDSGKEAISDNPEFVLPAISSFFKGE